MRTARLSVCLLVAASLASGSDIQRFSETTFCQDLYQKIGVHQTNVVFSPYSIRSALAMGLLGAWGKTAKEIAQVIFPKSLRVVAAHRALHNLVYEWRRESDVEIYSVNGVVVNPRVPVRPQFTNNVVKYYYADVFNLELNDVESPEELINTYVREATHGIITDLIPSDFIDPDTQLVLMSTVFFNGTWEHVFSVKDTHKEYFKRFDSTLTEVDMMTRTQPVNIKLGVFGADVIELPFKGKRFSLYIALPLMFNGITDLERSLSVPGNAAHLFAGLVKRNVQICIPKFRIESTFRLNDALTELGIVKAFDKSADFKRINAHGGLFISDIVHKAVIDITETGTEDTAASATEIVRTIGIQHFYKANHPFLFFLRDNHSGQVLFQGKFSDNEPADEDTFEK